MTFIATKKDEQNRAAVDPWTYVHLGSGLALGLLGVSFGRTMALGIGYDVAEYAFEESEFGQKFFNTSGPESPANIAVDLAIYGVGWWLGKRWNQT